MTTTIVKSYIAEIVKEHKAFIASAKTALVHAWQCGVLLNQVKDELPHGQFGEWFQEHKKALGFEERQARSYMSVAKRLPNRQRAADLPESSIRGLLAPPKL